MDEYTIRVYRYNINLFFYKYSGDSRPHRMKKGLMPFLMGLKYSLATIVFGFWGFGGKRAAIDALAVNFAGGLDYTKEITELDFDKETVYVYNNLSRQTSSKLSLEEVDILIELQNNYLKLTQPLYTQDNKYYLIEKLRKIKITDLKPSDLDNFFAVYDRLRSNQNNS
jgi:hypothetical protein